MTHKELSTLYDIKRALERIRSYCDIHSLRYDEDSKRWNYIISKADYGLIKVRDIEVGNKPEEAFR